MSAASIAQSWPDPESISGELLSDARRLTHLPDDRLVILFRRTSESFLALMECLGETGDSDVLRNWREVKGALGGADSADPDTGVGSPHLIARECAIPLALRCLSAAYVRRPVDPVAAAAALRRIRTEVDAAIISVR